MPHFVEPTARLRETYLDAMAEYAAEGRTGDGSGIGRDLADWSGRWETDEGFAAFVEEKRAWTRGEVPEGWVADTALWWVEGPPGAEVYIGRMSIRHELTELLLEVGGHIGYDVRRSRRRQGHATAMLRAALPVARDLGIESALVTCDHDNVASRRVIEKCGGALEDRRGVKLRYWVPTA